MSNLSFARIMYGTNQNVRSLGWTSIPATTSPSLEAAATLRNPGLVSSLGKALQRLLLIFSPK